MQVRIHRDKVAGVVQQLVTGELTWEEVQKIYPAQQAAAEEES